MARPAPQPCFAKAIAIGRIGAESAELTIRESLAANPNQQNRETQPILQPQLWRRIEGRQQNRQREWDADERLLLREPEHLPRSVRAPAANQRRITWIVGGSFCPLRDVKAKPKRPERDQAGDQKLTRG